MPSLWLQLVDAKDTAIAKLEEGNRLRDAIIAKRREHLQILEATVGILTRPAPPAEPPDLQPINRWVN